MNEQKLIHALNEVEKLISENNETSNRSAMIILRTVFASIVDEGRAALAHHHTTTIMSESFTAKCMEIALGALESDSGAAEEMKKELIKDNK